MTETRTDFVSGSPRIAYDHLGEGTPVVFLHGIGGNRTNWREALVAAAEAGFHAVAWDARGYGLSEDYDGPLDFADFSHDLLRLLDHLGSDRAHLVGLSMGGRILLDFYPLAAERVKSLVLCDTFPGFDESMTPDKRAEFVRLRKQPLVEGKEPRDIAPAVARTLLGPKSTDAHFRRLVDSMCALHKDSYIKAVEATTMYQRQAVLAEIRAPVLLIFGEADTLTPPEVGRRMAAAIPGARFECVADAGHLVNIEAPEAFNALLCDWLRRREA